MTFENPTTTRAAILTRNRFTNHDASEPSRYDLDLQQRVRVFLANQRRDSLRRLRVEARDGIVTLQGRVPSFYEREVSVRLARRVAGVLYVVDEIVIGCRQLDPRRIPQDGSAA